MRTIIQASDPVRFGDVNYTAVRASLVVDITPDIENYTIASYLDSDTNGDVQKMVGCNPSYSPVDFIGTVLLCAQLAQEQAKGAGFYDLAEHSSRTPIPVCSSGRSSTRRPGTPAIR